jgi:hypothetical protein
MAIIENNMPRNASVIAGSHAELFEINEDTFLSFDRQQAEVRLNRDANALSAAPGDEPASPLTPCAYRCGRFSHVGNAKNRVT